MSLVLHPRNPYAPTVHLNVRFFVATRRQAPTPMLVVRRRHGPDAVLRLRGGRRALPPRLPRCAGTFRRRCSPALQALVRRVFLPAPSQRAARHRRHLLRRPERRRLRALLRARREASATISSTRTRRSSSVARTRRSASASASSSSIGAAATSSSTSCGTAARCSACSRTGAPRRSCCRCRRCAQWRYDWKPEPGTPEARLYDDLPGAATGLDALMHAVATSATTSLVETRVDSEAELRRASCSTCARDRVRLPDGERGHARVRRASRRGADRAGARRWPTRARAAVSLSDAARDARVSRRQDRSGRDAARQTAERELARKSAIRPGTWTSLGTLHPEIGYSTEFIDVFVAAGLVHVGAQLDEGEFLDVVPMTEDELLATFDRGEFHRRQEHRRVVRVATAPVNAVARGRRRAWPCAGRRLPGCGRAGGLRAWRCRLGSQSCGRHRRDARAGFAGGGRSASSAGVAAVRRSRAWPRSRPTAAPSDAGLRDFEWRPSA